MKLTHKVAIISGAGSGIGRETALLFAKEGARIAVIDIDAKEGLKTVELTKKEDGGATFIPGDVANSSDVQKMVKTTINTFDRLDILVNIASEAGLVGIPNQVAYNVSKSGVVAFTKSTAVDFAAKNIRVNCLCPGRTLTPLVQEVIRNSMNPEETRRRLSEDRPLKRMGKPEEIAAGILFLASDDASYAIGSIFSIHGGYTAW